MVFEVELSEESEIDLKQIFDHLVQSYTQLGEPLEDAFDQASERIRRIRSDIFGLGKTPYQGTLSKEIGDGLRHVTKNRAVIYFDVYEATCIVQVIAVFFGGQDHQRHMLKRLSWVALLRLLAYRADTPLCPAGHLPHKGGERGGAGLSPQG